MTTGAPVELGRVLEVLEAVAPLQLASDWDNVGLLLHGTRPVRSLFLAIDLTEAVLAEAVEADADLVVSYHPPIFSGLKRLTERSPGGRVVLDCVRRGLHVYSPHTALDAARDGMAAWLLEGAGPMAHSAPIEADDTDPTVGSGRSGTLSEPSLLPDVVQRLKVHLGLERVRVAAPPELWAGSARVSRIAVCPGAGGSVLVGARDAELWITGEMRHHDVLSRVARGRAVVLADHTNTERGYLPTLAQTLRDRLGVTVHVSAVDADPLRIV